MGSTPRGPGGDPRQLGGSGLFSGGVPGQFGAPAALAAPGLEGNVAAQLAQAPVGAKELFGAQVPRGTDQKVNPNARMAVPQMRDMLAQAMQRQPRERMFGRGGSASYGTSGSRGASRTGSGWGRDAGGHRSTAGSGGLY